MHTLHIYPTSRSLRAVRLNQKTQNAFLPTVMRMDEFEHRVVLIEGKKQIDPLRRILFLEKAASFKAFEDLKVDLGLVRFFTKSEALFRFFEELAAEKVDFTSLIQADAYAEFGTHLAILERLLKNYHELLDVQGFTDKAFIPQSYTLNSGFIGRYDAIEIHLEGYLSHFELELIDKASRIVPLSIHYVTSAFNLKMQERFKAIGMGIPNDAYVTFSMTDKEILSVQNNNAPIKAKVVCTEERDEQIASAFMHIEKMIASGMAPQQIVLVLPDEDFKEHFTLFDTHKNLNFAMGYDYSKSRVYQMIEALYGYWQQFDRKSIFLLQRYGFDMEQVFVLNASTSCKAAHLFDVLEHLGLHDSLRTATEAKQQPSEEVHERAMQFMALFDDTELSLKEWLFLWLKSLSQITLDDVRGGKITVMGVLETRGVTFEGVVIVDFNEGIVPASSSKDQFLNSSVRTFANLPTKNDREALQKQYYKRLLEQAKEAVILYSTSNNKLPSKFLYELGLTSAQSLHPPSHLFYTQPSQCIKEETPVVKSFDAQTVVWSASRLKTYLECKRKYYYRYILKIQPKAETERNEGAFLHTLLDHVYKEQNYYTSADTMQKQIDSLLDTLLPFEDAKTAYQKSLWREKLKGFVATQIEHFASGWRVVEREKEVQGTIGGLTFTGRIDRIDQNETQTLALDYKSGSTAEAQKTKNLDTLCDFQMSIYAQLLQDDYNNLGFAFVKIFENGNTEAITMLEEKNALLAEHIEELKQTKQFEANKCEALHLCSYCEFALLCERGEYL